MIGARIESRRTGVVYVVAGIESGDYVLRPEHAHESPFREPLAAIERDYIVLTPGADPLPSEAEIMARRDHDATRVGVQAWARAAQAREALADEIGVDPDDLRDDRGWRRIYEERRP
jgi:hypothetical protein